MLPLALALVVMAMGPVVHAEPSVQAVIIPVRPANFSGSIESPLSVDDFGTRFTNGMKLYLGYTTGASPSALLFQVSRTDLNTKVSVSGCDAPLTWHSSGLFRTTEFPSFLFFESSVCNPVGSSISAHIPANTVALPSPSRVLSGEKTYLSEFTLVVRE